MSRATRTDTVVVLCGGHVSEHRISLATGATLVSGALAHGRTVVPVLIGEDGTWNRLPAMGPGSGPPDWPERVPTSLRLAELRGPSLEVAASLRRDGLDIVLLGLHGAGGEDGRMQGFLETAGFAHTGSGVAASAVGMDKILFKHLIEGVGLPTAPWTTVATGESCPETPELAALGWPRFVKAPGLGSSVSVHPAPDPQAFAAAVRAVGEASPEALVERGIAGREFSVPVLGTGASARALPTILIVPRAAGWFDYTAKYAEGGAEEIVPAPIDEALEAELARLALRTHAVIGGRGVTRTDFIVDPAGQPHILEINTLPGLTSASLVPRAAAAAGLSLPDLIEALIEDAAAAHRPLEVGS